MVYLNNNFEVKVISRVQSKRRKEIKNNLESKNIFFSFFDAADKTNITRQDKSFYYKNIKLDLNTTMPFPDAYNNRKWMKIGEVGCFFSHYLLWLDLLEKNKKAYFILEDDADPQFDGKDIEKFLNTESLNEVDMIICQSVSPNFPKGKKAFQNISNKMNKKIESSVFDWETTEGTTGYIITNSGAKKMIEIIKKYQMFNPIDNFIGRCVGNILTTYLCPDYLQVKLNVNVETEIHYDIPDQKIEYIDEIKFIIG